MKGVILSGGKGSRLAPITDNYPKQLVPVLGKPILFHCIEHLKKAGITEICIVLSPQTGKLIEEAIKKENFIGISIQFIYQDEPRGLAHAVGITRDFVGKDDVLVLLGDNLFDRSLGDMIESFYHNQSDSLILLKEVDRPYQFGVVKFDEQGRAEKLVEKPKEFVSNYAIVGVYIFSSKIFDAIDQIEPSSRGEFEITDAIALQVTNKLNIQTDILKSFWFDSGTREGLLDANKHLLISNHKFNNVDCTVTDSFMHGNIGLDKGSLIEKSNIMGPVFIGKNVKIFNSTIGPFTTIADNCYIENSELQETIVMEGTRVNNSQIYSSIIFKNLKIKYQPRIINELYA